MLEHWCFRASAHCPTCLDETIDVEGAEPCVAIVLGVDHLQPLCQALDEAAVWVKVQLEEGQSVTAGVGRTHVASQPGSEQALSNTHLDLPCAGVLKLQHAIDAAPRGLASHG